MSIANEPRITQRSLFSQEEMGVKSNPASCTPAAGVTNYLKTREALWRLIATYPKRMPVMDAICRVRIDFTKRRREVAL